MRGDCASRSLSATNELGVVVAVADAPAAKALSVVEDQLSGGQVESSGTSGCNNVGGRGGGNAVVAAGCANCATAGAAVEVVAEFTVGGATDIWGEWSVSGREMVELAASIATGDDQQTSWARDGRSCNAKKVEIRKPGAGRGRVEQAGQRQGAEWAA